MINTLQGLYLKFQNLLSQEEGQDLVEYALVVALISLGAVATMGSLGKAINGIFTTISTTLTSATP